MTEYNCTIKGVSYADACSGTNTKPEELGKTVFKKGSVFSDEDLLGIIFEHLSFEDLKSVRQINHLWNVEATKVLVHKFRTKPIQIFCDKVTFLKGKKEENPSMSLNAFSKFIEKSTSFPSSIKVDRLFRFLRPAQKENVINLFKWYGHIFKSLEFAEEITEENRNFMEQLLIQMLPNLQVLTINGFLNGLFVDAEALHFEKLKTLHLVGSAISPLVLFTVLRISKKLENIYFWDGSMYYENVIESYEKLNELNALHLLRSLDLYFHNSTLNFLEALSSDKNLTSVKIVSGFCFDESSGGDEIESSLDRARIGRILTEFFQRNCITLECVKDVHLLGEIPNESLTLPVFPKILRLSARHKEENIPVFPGGVELARIFPNLTSISLALGGSCYLETFCPRVLFPGSQSPVLTVKTFEITTQFQMSASWVEFVHRVFPNVVKAEFGALDDFKGASEFLWGLKYLEELHVDVAVRYDEQTFPKYDSAFTGLSSDTVKSLYETSEIKLNEMTANDLKALRSRPSITNLKRLKKLLVKFLYWPDTSEAAGCSHAEDLTSESQMILTYVSGRFAFNMCPQLRSNISIHFSTEGTHYLFCPKCFKSQDAFRTLAPFVSPISYDVEEYKLFESKKPTQRNEYADEDDEY